MKHSRSDKPETDTATARNRAGEGPTFDRRTVLAGGALLAGGAAAGAVAPLVSSTSAEAQDGGSRPDALPR